MLAGDIDLDGDRVAQRGGGLPGAVHVAIPQRDAAAAGGDFRSAGEADAARAAGHDGGAALEQIRLPWFPPKSLNYLAIPSISTRPSIRYTTMRVQASREFHVLRQTRVHRRHRSSLLKSGDYIADRSLATVLFLALKLGRPLFCEGEAGVGKTEIAKVLAATLKRPLIRLQCYEGLDVASAVYEWNYARQMIEIRLAEAQGVHDRGELAATSSTSAS